MFALCARIVSDPTSSAFHKNLLPFSILAQKIKTKRPLCCGLIVLSEVVDIGGNISKPLISYLSRFWEYYSTNKNFQIALEESR